MEQFEINDRDNGNRADDKEYAFPVFGGTNDIRIADQSVGADPGIAPGDDIGIGLLRIQGRFDEAKQWLRFLPASSPWIVAHDGLPGLLGSRPRELFRRFLRPMSRRFRRFLR